MKKIYLSALALSICSMSFGQKVDDAIARKTITTGKSIKSNTQAQNNKGAVLWDNDFDVPADWTMTANVAPDNWVMGDTSTTAPSGAFLIPNIISDDGKIALFDSDLMCSGNQDAQITTTAPITVLGSEPSVNLVFDNYHRRFNDSTFVIVSTNNVNWTKYRVNDVAVNAYGDGSTTAAAAANPHTVSVNISATAANQPIVYIGFLFQGGCDYSWMIDKVEIQQGENNELILTEPYFGTAAFSYSRIPVSQIQPIDYDGAVKNDGAVDQPNTVMTIDINSGAFTAASTPQTVLAGATDSIGTSWTPPATVGVSYVATMTVASDSTDITPANNTFTFPAYEISQYVYAYDDYGTPGAGGGTDDCNGNCPQASAFEAGNLYDIWAADNLTALDVVVGAGTPVGTNFKAVVYESTATGFTIVASTAFYQSTTAMIDNVTSLIFTSPVALNPNSTYFAGVSSLTEFYYGTSGNSSDGTGSGSRTSLIYYGTMDNPNASQNYFTTQTPMVRMNFDPALDPTSVEEQNNALKFNIFPNPSNGVFNINLSSNEANNVNLTVKNVVGQTVLTETVNVSGNTNHQISLTDYSKGIYFLTVNNETVKLIVE
ncbi:MAG: T9SS type A sorting domain-containing protein [Vicingaceae bacterium]|nr:T9SS type A sorting domain-containing protein [Vicingaceae bacterium]